MSRFVGDSSDGGAGGDLPGAPDGWRGGPRRHSMMLSMEKEVEAAMTVLRAAEGELAKEMAKVDVTTILRAVDDADGGGGGSGGSGGGGGGGKSPGGGRRSASRVALRRRRRSVAEVNSHLAMAAAIVQSNPLLERLGAGPGVFSAQDEETRDRVLREFLRLRRQQARERRRAWVERQFEAIRHMDRTGQRNLEDVVDELIASDHAHLRWMGLAVPSEATVSGDGLAALSSLASQTSATLDRKAEAGGAGGAGGGSVVASGSMPAHGSERSEADKVGEEASSSVVSAGVIGARGPGAGMTSPEYGRIALQPSSALRSGALTPYERVAVQRYTRARSGSLGGGSVSQDSVASEDRSGTRASRAAAHRDGAMQQRTLSFIRHRGEASDVFAALAMRTQSLLVSANLGHHVPQLKSLRGAALGALVATPADEAKGSGPGEILVVAHGGSSGGGGGSGGGGAKWRGMEDGSGGVGRENRAMVREAREGRRRGLMLDPKRRSELEALLRSLLRVRCVEPVVLVSDPDGVKELQQLVQTVRPPAVAKYL